METGGERTLTATHGEAFGILEKKWKEIARGRRQGDTTTGLEGLGLWVKEVKGQGRRWLS